MVAANKTPKKERWRSRIEPSYVLAAGMSAVRAVSSLRHGGRIVGVTKGEFSLLDLVRAVLTKVGPAAVTVSTWTPGASEMDRVCGLLLTGEIASFRLLVDRSFPTRHPQYVERLQAIVPASEIRMTKTHAKFALISGGEWRITIRTSMNFNANPRLEQFDLDDDPEMFAFFDGIVDTLFDITPPGLGVRGAVIQAAFTGAFRAGPPDYDALMADAVRDPYERESA